MSLDRWGSHLYISPGPNGTSIAVMNYDGTQDGAITNIPGPSGPPATGHAGDAG